MTVTVVVAHLSVAVIYTYLGFKEDWRLRQVTELLQKQVKSKSCLEAVLLCVICANFDSF